MNSPMNFKKWVEDNRHLLKPPVGNKCIYRSDSFIVMCVGGPNARTDFHVNESDEYFYQIEGKMFLRTINKEGKVEETHLAAGDMFMLPALVPHSPQRAEGSIGLVVELTRPEGSQDGLRWYCANCLNKLYEEFFYLENIETQFGGVYERYFNSDHTKCKSCQHENGKVWNPS
jgi:3-hydroxyanthranilate 3,4-dioxygenase